MKQIQRLFCALRARLPLPIVSVATSLGLTVSSVSAQQNLLKDPGLEETTGPENIPGWTTKIDSAGKVMVGEVAHSGAHGLVIPANTAVEQTVEKLPAGAYLARCWVNSEAEQPVTVLLQDPERPWSAYSCSEIKVPRGQWVQLEAFCALDRPGNLRLTVGGVSKEFRLYHGLAGELTSPMAADDFELIRYEAKAAGDRAKVAVWDAKMPLSVLSNLSGASQWRAVENGAQSFEGSAVLRGGHLAGFVRQSDGALAISALQNDELKARCVVAPSLELSKPKITMVRSGDRAGVRVTSRTGDRFYTAWFSTNGVVSFEAHEVPGFTVQGCQIRYGLLPSFAGTDLCYDPAKISEAKFNLPSTQWLVGLVNGSDSMMVAVWDTPTQPVSMGLSGQGASRMIDSLSIGTEKDGFSLSFVEHGGIWHQESLKEDWLGEYTPLEWVRPFPARWMGRFFVTSGGKPNFRLPSLDYSFPVACAKTRMWGVWFEDWNHYPFYFDGTRTIAHFEKTFVPSGDALFYFLEPAAADLISPVEIVQQALGPEKAAALLDLDCNRLRRLKYSTPALFMYDRPVCATTTRLSKIKKEDKPTVGLNLATHLFEFIREIRGRVDQYGAFFGDLDTYLTAQQKAHPELKDYVAELQTMVSEAQGHTKEIYATPLPEVQKKIEAMKERLEQGQTNGFDCAELDVRGPAGEQDDLCRRYNRLVMRLTQTAASKCGDSAEKAAVAAYVWAQSRAVLRQPTRWESRRTLYFFEP
jgi:hypothetical protein